MSTRFIRAAWCAAVFPVLGACAGSLPPHAGESPVSPRPAAQDAGLGLGTPLEAQPSRSPLAAAARTAFWEAFTAERYDAIPAVVARLNAALLENPRDAELTLLLAHAHLWRVSERERTGGRDPSVVEHLVLADHWFGEAWRLNPDDHRILGWLGSARVALGSVRRDSALAGDGRRLLAEGVRRYPEFNLFTAAFSRAGLPAEDPRFHEAVEALWRNIDLCSGVRDAAAVDAETYALAERADPSCGNTAKAPHNFEGFVLNLGDMLMKAGRTQEASAVYARARLAPEYAAWPYRELLEERRRRAEDVLAGRARPGPHPQMAGSAYSCAACHAHR